MKTRLPRKLKKKLKKYKSIELFGEVLAQNNGFIYKAKLLGTKYDEWKLKILEKE